MIFDPAPKQRPQGKGFTTIILQRLDGKNGSSTGYACFIVDPYQEIPLPYSEQITFTVEKQHVAH